MASNLQNAAARAVIKQHPCSFYDSFHSTKTNPVLVSFKKEKQNVLDFICDKKKLKTSLNTEIHGRLTMLLFEVWNKYQPLLPQDYYQKQLLEVGHFLVEQKEYTFALPLCFDRLLQELNIRNYELKSNELNDYQNWHFPHGLQTDTAILTIQALIGKYICSFKLVKMSNSMLTSANSVDKCLNILSLIRMLTQILLPHQNWCWLLYNCTIHIYTICQEMLLLGHSAKVLEFLVWACMCLENSLPLLGVQFLTWRSTLYMAVCHCYWDSMSGQQAEAFARRALCKITDLWQIEKLKQDGQVLDNDVNAAFREATLKMALMIFKRGVFETRRKHRNVLRVKNRFNIKDYLNVTWPRTPTEKLIVEMFDCGSAQFMAIVESLNSSRQRIAQTNGCSQWEIELIDSVTELFYAAKEILIGNAVTNATGKKSKKDQPVHGFVNLIDTEESTLMELATAGDNRIPLSAVFQLARLSFCYEQWDMFDILAEPLKVLSNQQYSWDVKSLEILSAIEKLISGRKRSKSQTSATSLTVIVTGDEDGKTEIVAVPSATSVNSATKTNGDDLIPLAQVLKSFLMEKFNPQQVDIDLVADAVLLLWNKSKVIIQRHQTGLEDKSKYFQKPENQHKWLHILDITLNVMSWCDMASIDSSILMEVAMRLALLLETTSQRTTENPRMSLKDSSSMSFTSDEDVLASFSHSLNPDFLGKSESEMLKMAKSVLEVTLEQVAKGRNTDELHIADVSWNKQEVPELYEKYETDEETNEKTQGGHSFEHLKLFESTVRSQHTELLLIYYRISFSLKNLELVQAKPSAAKSYRRTDPIYNYSKVLETLQVECGSNNLLKSLLYMQASLSLDICKPAEKKQMLEQSVTFLEKFQKEELKVFETNTKIQRNLKVEKRKVPPAPILLHRSGSEMVFKPAPFVSVDGDTVCWYRLFGHPIKSSNAKVRVNDMPVNGTGNLVLSDCKELSVSGLNLNQRYIFALAAYTSDGKLIGGGIGDSTKPILAMNPISILITYSFLCQSAYQLGFYSISQHAFNFLWSHFVIADKPKVSSDFYINSAFHHFKISRPKLNKHILASTAVSPILMRQMYCCVMAQVDIGIQQGDLVCNKLCDKGPFINGQKKRLKECEKLFVAIEISGWLNDYQLCLQAIVQCYGLLVPLIYHRVAVIPVVQILLNCLAALQELPVSVRQKRPASTSESLHHMTASMTYHAAKVLFEFNEKNLALRVCDVGVHILQQNLVIKKNTGQDSNQTSSINIGVATEEKFAAELKTQSQINLNKQIKRSIRTGSAKLDLLDSANEELFNLEVALNRLTKQISNENDLSQALTHDNQCLVLANIYSIPSAISSKEVNKYRKRSSYPELFLRVIEKAFSEGNHSLAQALCEDFYSFIKKKNETNFGIKYKRQPRKNKISESKQSEDTQKFAATVVEYGKDKESVSKVSDQTEKKIKKKKKQKIFPNETPEVENAKMNQSCQPPQRRTSTGIPLRPMALEILNKYLLEIHHRNRTLKAARKVLADELPLQSQLQMFLGLSQFNILIEKLDFINKTQPNIQLTNYGTYHDDNWFSFENTGLLLQVEKVNEESKKLEKKIKTPVDKKEKPGSATKVPSIQIRYSGSSSQTVEMNYEGNQEVFKKALVCLQRSLVLAHRGNMWSLLQNNAKILWDVIQTIQFRLVSVYSDPAKDSFQISFPAFNKLVYPILALSSDLLLDMLKKLEEAENNVADKPEKPEETNTFYEHLFETIDNVKRGSLLNYEPFLDDTIVLDIRLVQKICMKTITVLHHQKKWEHLADIVLRFNALTNKRFAEFTLPFLIEAQKNLLNYLESTTEALSLPQPHIKRLMDKVGDTISDRDYLHAQFTITLEKQQILPVPPEARLDLYGNTLYKENIDGCRLISVPLDLDYSWKCIENITNATNYCARALNHSRRLLGIYLIAQQQLKYEEFTEEENILKPFSYSIKALQEPLPQHGIDLFNEERNNTLTSKMASDLLENVIVSYSHTTEILLNKNEIHLAAQGFTELGDVYFIAGSRRVAYQTWSRSLKLILGLNEKPVLDWKQVYPEKDPGLQLLQHCGIWGCLHGAIAATNIARYAVSNDWLLSLQYCLLAYNLFKALYRSSVQHPLSDRQYALYEMGEGCPITYLVPGVQIFSDQYRCNAKQLLSSLQFVISKFYLYEHYLKILPLLALHLYFARSLCRDVKLCVQGQIQKVLTLTNLHLYSDAIKTLQQLLHGERLPQVGSPYFRPAEVKMEVLEFESSVCFHETVNLKVFDSITEKQLPNNLTLLYGAYLSNELLLAHAHLLVSLAECLNVIPDEKESTSAATPVPTQIQKNKSSAADDRQTSSIKESSIYHERFGTMEKLKHQLILSATNKLDILMDELKLKSIYKNKKLKASELDLAVRCLLLQSNICLQKQQSYFAAKSCAQALNMIQNSQMFCLHRHLSKPKRRPTRLSVSTLIKSVPDVDKKSKQNPEIDKYLINPDILGCQQWLQCRLRLVQALLTEVSIPVTWLELGDLVIPEFPTLENLCHDGQDESQTWNNPEMEAAFIYVHVVKLFETTHFGKSCEPLLKKGINLLKSCPELSYSGLQNLLAFHLLETDLKISSPGPLAVSMVKKTLKSYIKIQGMAEKLLRDLGECIQHTTTTNQELITCPVIPLKNIYLSPLNILIQVKLRISLMMAKLYLKPINLCTTIEIQQRNSHLHDCLAVLKNAHQLNRKSFFWNAGLEVEILLQMGKLQRELSKLNLISPFIALGTLLDAIKVSFFAHHSLILMKTAYLEIALIALSQLKKPEIFVCQRTKAKSNLSGRLVQFSLLGPNIYNQFAMIAWLAVRSAAIITSCRGNLTNLIQPGKLGIHNELSAESKNNMPNFLNLDLFGKYIFGKKKKIYKNEFEEDYDQMMEAGMTEYDPSKEERLIEIKDFSGRHITWSYVLYYSFHLFEQQHRNMISVNRTLQEEEDVTGSSRQSHTTFHQAFLCCLNLGLSQQIRYATTYSFLTENFLIFNKQCSISYIAPKLEDLIELENSHSLTSDLPNKERFSTFEEERTLPSEFHCLDFNILSEQKLPYPNVNEVCFQWYSASFNSVFTALHQHESPIYLLCTATEKKEKPGELTCLIDYFIFPHNFITDIYKRIKKTIHLKEVQQKASSPLQQLKTSGGTKQKSKIHVNIGPSEISTDMEIELMKEIFLILDDIQTLLKPNAEKLTKAPFELNNPNLNQLLEMFDVSSGSCLITSDIASWILKLIFP